MTGGTDSTGPAQYNYDLSQRRADAVVQYLAAKYNIPAHRFYLIGIGKDQEVADNTTREGRKRTAASRSSCSRTWAAVSRTPPQVRPEQAGKTGLSQSKPKTRIASAR